MWLLAEVDGLSYVEIGQRVGAGRRRCAAGCRGPAPPWPTRCGPGADQAGWPPAEGAESVRYSCWR
ncbi:hypothetical protein ACFQ0O_39445 [Saccharopolyspora spinosporotrichia]